MSVDDTKESGLNDYSDWEDMDMTSMMTRAETMGDSEVIRRFLVTKDKTLMSMGTTTKYLEVLHDGSVRVRDVKKSTYDAPIYEPWKVFQRTHHKVESQSISKISQLKNKSKGSDPNELNLKVFMDHKKKRYFKFSTEKEKSEFFDLIEKSRKRKDRSHKKQNYSTEPFVFAPYEVVGFFIRNAVVHRQGSTIKYRGKLIAITNYRIVVIDSDTSSSNSSDDHNNDSNTNHSNHNNNNNNENGKYSHENGGNDNDGGHEDNINSNPHKNVDYNNPYDQSSSYKQNKLTRGDHIIPALTVPHHSVYDYTTDGDKVVLDTKDYRTVTIDLSTIPNSTLRTQSSVMLKRYLLPMDEKDIFAFAAHFSVIRTKTPSQSEHDISKLRGFPALTADANSNKHRERRKNVSMGSHFSSKDNSNNGNNNGNLVNVVMSDEYKMQLYLELKDSRYHIDHSLELMKREYRRLGWNSRDTACPFRLTAMNLNFGLCETYPRLLMVPYSAKDALLKNASLHRSRNRLPVITWCNSYNVSMARSSQPQSGVSHKRNSDDEQLLLLLNGMNEYSESYVICDCRPRVNALANQYMRGKGFEGSHYEKAHIIFFDIQNIHEMRKSVNLLKKCCEDQLDPNWLQNLHETKWFQHITKIIQCARRCANMIDCDKYSVLVHCSDGWDRTAQVCALAELLLDPYYRTFSGFLILIEKEWIWFGHKFSDRNGNYGMHSDRNKKERSPIFLQFLDCTFQIMMQFPWAFDFTQDLLLEFVSHCNSGRFGDFFCNWQKERVELDLWLKTPSLFKYLHALWKLGRFRNADYIPTKTVLRPRYAVRDMILWDEVYCRFTMHDKDRHGNSVYSPNHNLNLHIATAESMTVTAVASIAGKNRYHPRSPRISKMDNGGQSIGDAFALDENMNDDEDAAATPRSKNKRSKPKPPPPKPNPKQSKTHSINHDLTACVCSDHGSDNPQMDFTEPINVNNDKMRFADDDMDSDYSDSQAIPHEVQRITELKRKVRELQAILDEYKAKDKKSKNKNNQNNHKSNIV